ncbi:homoserine O-succinyltransferase [Acetobacter nitrogenifigens DSM 23921 = NBRC 105050]|uniref:Homoserine O-acetyltransferase n=1 Tax=Acetobacter nitrogenifigens DSM 23921 = NBRC 105050 TaxID=1120919 RepID=A0A511XDA0_9PROT|nr:homoserine O-succinyltransferase [Acetobacter nitrogenifigens]GBQ89998.1 homoserine O-succinyltransferase [Acetobacter nitrogenifigens DSM 23921 = NBRC 105050]GEN60930.1 homoserine O-succinyltransferase [Acetobacter nitrogenifigens DSM 23921 = NBRC 105050]
MPIKIPDNLPARATLEAEGVMVMGETDAIRQDIRPLRIGLLNLMPNKISTETQIARLIGATPLQVELSLVSITGHVSRHTAADHMTSFYRPWSAVRQERFDGFIVTGAPVERLPFEAVTYWDELRRIFDWTQTNVHHTLTICWAAQAAARHFHGMPKHLLPEKAFGIFDHAILAPASPYLVGFSDEAAIPVSRWTEVRREDIPSACGLEVLAESAETGLCMLDNRPHRMLHMFNHLEYDARSLASEYFRDRELDPATALPCNYFPNNDPSRKPSNSWRSHAHLLAANWINHIYQTTPFDLSAVGREQRSQEMAGRA